MIEITLLHPNKTTKEIIELTTDTIYEISKYDEAAFFNHINGYTKYAEAELKKLTGKEFEFKTIKQKYVEFSNWYTNEISTMVNQQRIKKGLEPISPETTAVAQEPVIETKQSDMIKEHLRVVDRLESRKDLDKETAIQKKELKEYLEPLMEGKPTKREEEKAKKFEEDADFNLIKRTVLGVNCRRIDKELVSKMTNKKELIAYLRERKCPALIRLEAVLERTFE